MISLNKKYAAARPQMWSPIAWLVALTSLALAGCVTSAGPILTDGKAILGDGGYIHLFGTPVDGVRTSTRVTFRWSGSRYVVGRSRSLGISDFTVHAYEGRDLIVQGRTTRPPHRYDYALARKLADGVYLLVGLNEDEVGDTARNRFCTKTADASCRIQTPEQLFALARVIADKEQESGGIAVVLPRKGR